MLAAEEQLHKCVVTIMLQSVTDSYLTSVSLAILILQHGRNQGFRASSKSHIYHEEKQCSDEQRYKLLFDYFISYP